MLESGESETMCTVAITTPVEEVHIVVGSRGELVGTIQEAAGVRRKSR